MLRLRVRRVPMLPIALACAIVHAAGYFLNQALAAFAPPANLLISGSITVTTTGSLAFPSPGGMIQFGGPTLQTASYLLGEGFAFGLVFALLLQALASAGSLRIRVEAD